MFKSDYLEEFLSTALERHNIFTIKSTKIQKPWTDDPVLRDFFFCNLFRQYDKCSKWIIEKILPYGRWDLIILYRFISTYKTFKRLEEAEELGQIELDSLEDVEQCLRVWKEDGPVFAGCFIRNPSTSIGVLESYRAVFQHIIDLKAMGFDPRTFSSMESMCLFLRQVKGIAGFMSYEYACDFAYTNSFHPTDKYSWANMGPGAKQGMSFLVHGYRRHNFNQKEWLTYAVKLLPLLKKRINTVYPMEDVTLREVEHWLCEYQKYVKYACSLNGGIKVKHRKYEGVGYE